MDYSELIIIMSVKPISFQVEFLNLTTKTQFKYWTVQINYNAKIGFKPTT